LARLRPQALAFPAELKPRLAQRVVTVLRAGLDKLAQEIPGLTTTVGGVSRREDFRRMVDNSSHFPVASTSKKGERARCGVKIGAKFTISPQPPRNTLAATHQRHDSRLFEQTSNKLESAARNRKWAPAKKENICHSGWKTRRPELRL
jgi:hypothetical protein